MAHHPVSNELPARRFESKPRGVMIGAGIAVLLGALLWTLAVAGVVGTPERAWRAYLHNWLFWASIAQGAIMFAGALIITGARWAQPVRRIALSTAPFLPLAFVLLIPILLAARQIFPWAAYPEMLHHPKDMWMALPFVTGRILVLYGALVLISLAFVFFAIRPDAGLTREQFGARSGLYGFMTRSWRGQEVEEAHSWKRLRVLAVVMGAAYAVALSFIAFDFVQALELHFLSTLIGGYFFMGAFLGGVALTGLLTVITRRALGLGDWIRSDQLHDIGKLTFAFCVFWAYLFWAQYIVIWYGKLIPEQAFLINRMSEPYGPLALTVFLCLFVLPFFGLLGVAPKRRPAIYGTFAMVILFGLWLERYVLVYPSLYPGADGIPFGLAEIGATLLFGGLFVTAVVFFLSTFPVLQIWEAPSDPHPDLADARYQEPMQQVTQEGGS